jgi:hypothetical protein
MKDLSTLEYLYVLRCCSASSETHSCLAVSVHHPTMISIFPLSADTRHVVRTFAWRHDGLGDGCRQRHEGKGRFDQFILQRRNTTHVGRKVRAGN